jgi:hypothetical protein
MSQDSIVALTAILPQIFSPEELRAWLPRIPDGDRIVGNLPGGTAASSHLFYSAVDILRRYGLLAVSEFWDPLEEAAPFALKEKVRELRSKFGVVATALPPPRPTPSSGQGAASAAPITVVLVSASPEPEVRVRVDVEFRDIIAKVRSSPARDQIHFEQVQAARFEDLRAALIAHKPHVLHISSHGEEDGSLRLEARDSRGSQGISKRRLLGLLTELNDNLRLVVVNACHSEVLARDLPPAIDVAIGMNTAVADTAAIDFAVSFYEVLADGRSVEKAFKVALSSLEDGDHEVPQLFPSADQDPQKKRQTTLLP